MEFCSEKPTVSALYLVDRDKQGKAYRYYNADTDQWGMCGFDMNEALDNKDKTAVGFYPWVGPLTGKNFKPQAPVLVVEDDKPAKVAKPARGYETKKRMAKAKTVGAPVAPKSGKATHADGTVFYRADRQKWVAVWAGKQEAARPTAEACLNFLKKKYGIDGTVIPKE